MIKYYYSYKTGPIEVETEKIGEALHKINGMEGFYSSKILFDTPEEMYISMITEFFMNFDDIFENDQITKITEILDYLTSVETLSIKENQEKMVDFLMVIQQQIQTYKKINLHNYAMKVYDFFRHLQEEDSGHIERNRIAGLMRSTSTHLNDEVSSWYNVNVDPVIRYNHIKTITGVDFFKHYEIQGIELEKYRTKAI